MSTSVRQIRLPLAPLKQHSDNQLESLIKQQSRLVGMHSWEIEALLDTCRRKSTLEKGFAIVYEYAGHIDRTKALLDRHVRISDEVMALLGTRGASDADKVRALKGLVENTVELLREICSWRRLQWCPRPVLVRALAYSREHQQSGESAKKTTLQARLRNITEQLLPLLSDPNSHVSAQLSPFHLGVLLAPEMPFDQGKALFGPSLAPDTRGLFVVEQLFIAVRNVLFLEDGVASTFRQFRPKSRIGQGQGQVGDPYESLPVLRLFYEGLNIPSSDKFQWFWDSEAVYRVSADVLFFNSGEAAARAGTGGGGEGGGEGLLSDYHVSDANNMREGSLADVSYSLLPTALGEVPLLPLGISGGGMNPHHIGRAQYADLGQGQGQGQGGGGVQQSELVNTAHIQTQVAAQEQAIAAQHALLSSLSRQRQDEEETASRLAAELGRLKQEVEREERERRALAAKRDELVAARGREAMELQRLEEQVQQQQQQQQLQQQQHQLQLQAHALIEQQQQQLQQQQQQLHERHSYPPHQPAIAPYDWHGAGLGQQGLGYDREGGGGGGGVEWADDADQLQDRSTYSPPRLGSPQAQAQAQAQMQMQSRPSTAKRAAKGYSGASTYSPSSAANVSMAAFQGQGLGQGVSSAAPSNTAEDLYAGGWNNPAARRLLYSSKKFCATVLQCVVRRFLARKAVKAKRIHAHATRRRKMQRASLALEGELGQHAAASLIQMRARGVLGRHRVIRMIRAALVICKVLRKYISYINLRKYLRRIERPCKVHVSRLSGLPSTVYNRTNTVSVRVSMYWSPLLHIATPEDIARIVTKHLPQFAVTTASYDCKIEREKDKDVFGPGGGAEGSGSASGGGSQMPTPKAHHSSPGSGSGSDDDFAGGAAKGRSGARGGKGGGTSSSLGMWGGGSSGARRDKTRGQDRDRDDAGSSDDDDDDDDDGQGRSGNKKGGAGLLFSMPQISMQNLRQTLRVASSSVPRNFRSSFAWTGNRADLHTPIANTVCCRAEVGESMTVAAAHGNAVIKFEVFDEMGKVVAWTYTPLSLYGSLMMWDERITLPLTVTVPTERRTMKPRASISFPSGFGLLSAAAAAPAPVAANKKNKRVAGVSSDQAASDAKNKPLIHVELSTGTPLNSRCSWAKVKLVVRGPLTRTLKGTAKTSGFLGKVNDDPNSWSGLFEADWRKVFLSLDGSVASIFDSKCCNFPVVKFAARDIVSVSSEMGSVLAGKSSAKSNWDGVDVHVSVRREGGGEGQGAEMLTFRYVVCSV